MNEIISNLNSDNNHYTRLLKSFKNATDIFIVSPFLSNSTDFFPFEKLDKLNSLRLLTTLKKHDLDQYSKVNFFKSLFDFCEQSKITLKILIDNSLHGKVYISKFKNGKSEAIITSANFTSNGLQNNNEWGTITTNQLQISKLENDILREALKQVKRKNIDEFLKKLTVILKKQIKSIQQILLSSETFLTRK